MKEFYFLCLHWVLYEATHVLCVCCVLKQPGTQPADLWCANELFYVLVGLRGAAALKTVSGIYCLLSLLR